MTKNTAKIIALTCVMFSNQASGLEVDLTDFDKKLAKIYSSSTVKLEGPEAELLTSLESISKGLRGRSLPPEVIGDALTLLSSTDLIERKFPSAAKISFPENFLVGSNLSISDLSNASFFLNSLNKKQLENIRAIEKVASNSAGSFYKMQNQLLEFSSASPRDLIDQLTSMPEIDLVQVSAELEKASGSIAQATAQAENSISSAVSSSSAELQGASNLVQSATQTLSYAAGQAMSVASYSLDQAAQTISDTMAAGVSVDLEAASQGLGYGSFADAVNAYNEQYGTNYTVESAKEALGQ